jgi:hypothetical protein
MLEVCREERRKGLDRIVSEEGAMNHDVFGNLRDWGDVLRKLEELRESRKLDEHQPGLVRILRYRDNWKLRETVMRSLKEITRPSAELVREILKLAMDEGTYYQARILAVQALPRLLKRFEEAGDDEASTRSSVIESMQGILSSPQPPLLHDAVKESFPTIVQG